MKRHLYKNLFAGNVDRQIERSLSCAREGGCYYTRVRRYCYFDKLFAAQVIWIGRYLASISQHILAIAFVTTGGSVISSYLGNWDAKAEVMKFDEEWKIHF